MPTAADAFVTAYGQHLAAIGSYLSRRVESRFVEDLAADVFAIAWRKRDSVTVGEELPWLYRIAANIVANHRRKQAAAVSFLSGFRLVDSAPAAEDIVIADQTLSVAWKRLRPRDRELLGLAILDDLPVADIAVSLGISPNAVSIRLHRAKKALGDLLREPISVDSERSGPPPT